MVGATSAENHPEGVAVFLHLSLLGEREREFGLGEVLQILVVVVVGVSGGAGVDLGLDGKEFIDQHTPDRQVLPVGLLDDLALGSGSAFGVRAGDRCLPG